MTLEEGGNHLCHDLLGLPLTSPLAKGPGLFHRSPAGPGTWTPGNERVGQSDICGDQAGVGRRQKEAGEGQATVGEEMAIDPASHSIISGLHRLSAWWRAEKGCS